LIPPQRISLKAQNLSALAILALPFAIAVIALHGLSDHIQTFHGSDEEIDHLPIIRGFIATFPRMDLSDYPAAMTPLFHVVMAAIGKLVSSDIRVLRAVNVLVTYASAIALFGLFRREVMAGWLTSLLVALTIVLSPYVFGISFLLLTDNLAMLFAVGSIWCAMHYVRTGQWNVIALAALLAGCAVLTRQFYLWLLVLIVVASLARKLERPSEEALSGVLVLSVLAVMPVAVLWVLWGGLTPPTFHFYAASTLRIAPLAFFTACLGFYSLPFLALGGWKNAGLGLHTRPMLPVALVLAVSAMLLWLGRLHYIQGEPDCSRTVMACVGTDGYLWRLSQLFPGVGQTSLLFLVLVPVGIFALWCAPRNKVGLFAITIYLSFGFLSIGQGSLVQKYYDLPALVVSCLIFAGPENERTVRAILLLYCVVFIAYVVTKPYHAGLVQGAT
jgi:hypothetical protein